MRRHVPVTRTSRLAVGLQQGGRGPGGSSREPAAQDIVFSAFAADCRLRGRLHMRGERLTEQVNGLDPIDLADVHVEGLEDGRMLDVGDLTVERDELYAVVVEGTRGDPARRLRTMSRMVDVSVGPYRVAASLHATPAADPMHRVTRGPAFVPLTDATIRYHANGEDISESVPVLLVNRLLATVFRAVDEPRGPAAREVE